MVIYSLDWKSDSAEKGFGFEGCDVAGGGMGAAKRGGADVGGAKGALELTTTGAEVGGATTFGELKSNKKLIN